MKKMLLSSLRPFTNRRVAHVLALPALMVLITGCPSGNRPAQSSAPVSGKIVIKGSNTIGEELAPRLIAEYKKEQPGVTIELESKGTASGFAAVLAGEADIAAASRVASADELTSAQGRGIELNLHTIGSYSVGVVVNANNPVSNLSREQVRDIFSGAITNWKEIGGSDAPITVCTRDKSSGAPMGFQELAMENKPYAADAKQFTNYASIVTAVAADANAIGYTSFELLNKAGVKAAMIRGVPATAVTVNEGQYPISRVLRFYTNKTNETAAAASFIEFVQSPKGQAILSDAGFVPRL